MALITCPDCGKSISSLAPSCIHCGRPIKNELIVKKPDILTEIANEKRVSCQDGLCTGIIGKDGTCKTCGRPFIESDNEGLLERHDNGEIQSSQTKCSDCGGLLKEGSNFCSKCGIIQINEENVKNINDHRPIEEKVLEASLNKTNQNNKNNKAIWIGIAVVIFILLSIVGKKTNNSTNNASTNTDDDLVDARLACAKAIKNAATYGANPSAIFDAAAVRTGDNILVRFSDFEINNAFGAKRKSTAVCIYVPATKTVGNLRINGEKVF